MKTILISILNILSRLTLNKFKPTVIGLTGSVGKTSTKEAVAAVLSKHFTTRASFSSYNNEFGLPLTILGEKTPGGNPIKWIVILIRGFIRLLGSNYPKVLILEMGADRSGDIASLLKTVKKLDVAIITDIGISHLENYSNLQALVNEKLSILKGLDSRGTAILNSDNEKIAKAIGGVRQNKSSYGFNSSADIMASDVQLLKKDDSYGINFKIHHKGTVVPFFIPNSLGQPTVYSALAAAGVALSLGLNLVNISEALKSYEGPPGRLRYIKGIKRTWIIDDTYNSAPASVHAALEALSQVAAGRKVAVLGDMAELGPENEKGHKQVAVKIQELGINVAALVGDNGRIIHDELIKRKFSGKLEWFKTSNEACLPVQNIIIEGDTILIKGSQSTRMERVVKEIMADPMNAENLLVRQSTSWLAKP